MDASPKGKGKGKGDDDKRVIYSCLLRSIIKYSPHVLYFITLRDIANATWLRRTSWHLRGAWKHRELSFNTRSSSNLFGYNACKMDAAHVGLVLWRNGRNSGLNLCSKTATVWELAKPSLVSRFGAEWWKPWKYNLCCSHMREWISLRIVALEGHFSMELCPGQIYWNCRIPWWIWTTDGNQVRRRKAKGYINLVCGATIWIFA